MRYSDNKIDKPFEIHQLNIGEVRDMLIHTYMKNGIDLNDISLFQAKEWNGSIQKFNITHETYIFQSLSLLRMNDGSYQLLDGFRRLFSNDSVPTNKDGIFYIFNEADFTQEELFYLIIKLNQPKFIGNNGNLIERGVALYLKYNFNINIINAIDIIRDYLTAPNLSTIDTYRFNDSKARYNNNQDLVIERMQEHCFINVLKFISDLTTSYPKLSKVSILGSFLYSLNENRNNLNFNNIEFSKAFEDLYIEDKFDKSGVREMAKLNSLYQELTNAINISVGNQLKKSYSEAIEDFNTIKTQIKKDKLKAFKLLSYKDNYSSYEVMKLLKEDSKHQLKFRVVRKPHVTNVDFDRPLVFDITVGEVDLYNHLLKTIIHLKNVTLHDEKLVTNHINNILHDIEKMEYNINGSEHNRYDYFFYYVGRTDDKLTITDKRKDY